MGDLWHEVIFMCVLRMDPLQIPCIGLSVPWTPRTKHWSLQFFSSLCRGKTISMALTLLHLLFSASSLEGSQDFSLVSPQVQGMYRNISAALGLAEDSCLGAHQPLP